MKTLLVAIHDRDIIRAALIEAECEVDESVTTPSQLRSDAAYDIAVVELCNEDLSENGAKKVLPEDAPGLVMIRAIARRYPACAILAITHSKMERDSDRAVKAGAHWFQSVDWTHQPSVFLRGQIEHAINTHKMLSR